MSSNVDEWSDHSSMATALSCSGTQLEQTSPTAGEPAVSAVVKSASPTSTKKAWRQRLAMDDALAAATAALATIPPPTSSVEVQPTADSGGPPRVPTQSQLFVCRQCGKCFITLKYLEMHNALHTCQSTSTAVQVHPTVPPIQPSPPRQTATLDRAFLLSHLPAVPSSEAFLRAGLNLPAAQTVVASTTMPPARYRDWTCDICRKKFSQNSSYKNHQRTHSDERPFVCDICSIGFKERYHLKKHTLFKHSNETREQCRVCGKRFKG